MTRIRRAMIPAAAALAAAALGACSEPPPRPSGPATVQARLTSPNGAEGAALVEITGRFSDLAAAGGTTLLAEQVNDSTARLLLLAAQGGVLSFEVFLPEQRTPPRVVVVQVADTLNQLRASVAGYGVTF